jgi:hypothetical protein
LDQAIRSIWEKLPEKDRKVKELKTKLIEAGFQRSISQLGRDVNRLKLRPA